MTRILNSGFEDVRAQRMELPTIEPVLDAIDWLEQAAEGNPTLHAVIDKLSAYLRALGVERLHSTGGRIDARRFRIAEVQQDPAPGGTVLRCLRAAVMYQGEVVREGDVVVSSGAQ